MGDIAVRLENVVRLAVASPSLLAPSTQAKKALAELMQVVPASDYTVLFRTLPRAMMVPYIVDTLKAERDNGETTEVTRLLADEDNGLITLLSQMEGDKQRCAACYLLAEALSSSSAQTSQRSAYAWRLKAIRYFPAAGSGDDVDIVKCVADATAYAASSPAIYVYDALYHLPAPVRSAVEKAKGSSESGKRAAAGHDFISSVLCGGKAAVSNYKTSGAVTGKIEPFCSAACLRKARLHVLTAHLLAVAESNMRQQVVSIPVAEAQKCVGDVTEQELLDLVVAGGMSGMLETVRLDAAEKRVYYDSGSALGASSTSFAILPPVMTDAHWKTLHGDVGSWITAVDQLLGQFHDEE